MQPPVLESPELSRSRPPLTLPAELWATLSPGVQANYRRAESLLDLLIADRSLPLRDLITAAQGSTEEALAALQVLDGMDLVSVEAADNGPVVELVAVPDEHIRLLGPDKRPRWLLVARPIDPPDVDRAFLN